MMTARSPRRWRLTATLLLFTSAVALLPGCGNSDEKFETVPVSGKVMVGNTPVPMGRVTFHPDKDKGNTLNKLPSGNIEADGTYKLTTLITNGEKEGAPAGWYKVTVEPVGMSDPNQAKLKMPRIESRYNTVGATTLSVEVKPGAPANAYDLKLTN